MKLLSRRTNVIIATILVIVIGAIAYNYNNNKITELPPMTVQEKKARFISLIVPAVDHVYEDLMTQYQAVKSVIDSGESNDEIEQLKIEYKADTNKKLLMALKPHPKSIAIAQAAMESSWATSRFSSKLITYLVFGHSTKMSLALLQIKNVVIKPYG